MDHVGWNIIDAKRAEVGYVPVSHMGMVQAGQQLRPSPGLAALTVGSRSPYANAAALAEHRRQVGFVNEPFDRRQPEHVALAGLLGLGVFEAERIEHRVVNAG